MNILGTTRRRTVFVAMLFASLLILRTPASVFGQDAAAQAGATMPAAQADAKGDATTATPATATQPATPQGAADATVPANATATPAAEQGDKKDAAPADDKAATTGDQAANKSQPAAGGAAATGAAPAAGAKPRLSPVVLVAIIIAVFAIPMWLGGYFSRRLKMQDHGWKMSLALIMFLASGVIVYFGEFKLGPDLAGGVTLIYEVQDAGGREVKMSELIAALKKRVDPTSTREVTIRAYGNSPAVEVIIPKTGGDELVFIKRSITELGQLEFRITANPTRGDIQGIIAQAKLAPPGQTDVIIAGEKKAEWVPYEVKEFSAPEVPDDRMVKRMGLEEPEALVLIDPLNVSGEYLTNASKGVDERGGPAVHFSFNSRGAAYFGQLTSENLPNQATGAKRYLGIILDKRLVNAPSINSKITDQGMISGGSMSEQEVDHTVSILNAGSLPAVLNKTPVSENYTSSTLGELAIRQGKTAIIVSFVAIVLFMMFYYRLAGVISVAALILNLLMVLALMMMIKAAFTLPGLAGLVLTIGIAVDANVLIFERIREELRHGAALRMAIRNGYERATRTIVDANMTTIIAAVVMYLVGRDQIKGFAVTLILGVLVSMFTAIFCSRIVFDVLERKGLIKTLKMRSIIGETNIDFMGWQYWAIGISWVCILIGFIAVFARGQGLFNIDFTGGSSVTFVLDPDHPKPIELVQAPFEASELQHKSLVVVRNGESDRRYTVNTSEQSVDKVKQIVVDKFGKELMNYSFEIGALKPFSEGDLSGTEAVVQVNSGPKYTKDDGISHDAIVDQIRSALKADGKTDIAVTATAPGYRIGSSVRFKEWNLRLTSITPDGTRTLLEKVKTEMDATPMFPLANKIGGRVSANLQLQALKAISMSCFGIIAYLWLRFQKASFGLAAVIALLHDVFFTIGMVAMSYYAVQLVPGLAKLLKIDSFQISLDIVAALLTIIGYSVNDTIIVFDRLREVRGKSPELTIDMINASVNQTLGRTLLTSFTVFLVVVILYWIGGEGIHGFAYCMVIGVFVGTYSSIYIASPILYWLSGTKKTLADKGAAPRNVGQRAQAMGG